MGSAAERKRPEPWTAQAGSQVLFLSSVVEETLYEGERGGGKTLGLIMSFAQHCNRGHGAAWRGVIFRKTYKQLRDIEAKSREAFGGAFPSATFNGQEHAWTWPGGEQLFLSYMRNIDDYWNYHGHDYPFVGWEELTQWADPSPYLAMFSCVRSSDPGVPRMIRATTNPYGVGHNWVKARWRLPEKRGVVIPGDLDASTGERGPDRVALCGLLSENVALTTAEPGYMGKLSASAKNKSQRRAWMFADWDVLAGGMFDDVWSRAHHVVPDFPASSIPRGWRLDRSYDHGTSKPFSVGWHAQSDGEPFEWEGRTIGPVRGDVVRLAEWYGWNGTPNEGVRMLAEDIARGIVDREEDLGVRGRVRPGPADGSIFDDYSPGASVAGDMARHGVRWTRADKARKQGWEQCRKYLSGAVPSAGMGRDSPGYFVTERCEQFQRTVPFLPRLDRDLDDADSDAEDHIADEFRYRLRRKRTATTQRDF